MKLLSSLLIGGVSLFAISASGTEYASMTAFCSSIRFQRGLEADGNYYLELGSATAGNDGELSLDFFHSGYTHSAYLKLTDELLGTDLSGELALDVPDGGDANHDGFADFFQTSQGITNLANSGYYQVDIYGSGATTAIWNRAAGSKDGTCTLTMRLMPLKAVTFQFGFEILEYKGTLAYMPGVTSVLGTSKMVQTGNAANFFSTEVEFVKSPTNRFNDLALQSGSWTNESNQVLQSLSQSFSRDDTWPTNYCGYLEFDDDNTPATHYPYGIWLLSIDDLNDADRDSIPDFSDDPASGQLPRQPQLDFGQKGTNLVFVLHGDVGFVHEIQEVTELVMTNWQPVISLTLSSDPQKVTVPSPGWARRFYRAVAR